MEPKFELNWQIVVLIIAGLATFTVLAVFKIIPQEIATHVAVGIGTFFSGLILPKEKVLYRKTIAPPAGPIPADQMPPRLPQPSVPSIEADPTKGPPDAAE